MRAHEACLFAQIDDSPWDVGLASFSPSHYEPLEELSLEPLYRARSTIPSLLNNFKDKLGHLVEESVRGEHSSESRIGGSRFLTEAAGVKAGSRPGNGKGTASRYQSGALSDQLSSGYSIT